MGRCLRKCPERRQLLISDFSARPKLALLEHLGDARREKQPTETQMDVYCLEPGS
jgi:hypothetical protein